MVVRVISASILTAPYTVLGDRNPTLPEDDGDEEYEEWDDACYDSRQDPDYNFKMQVSPSLTSSFPCVLIQK